MDQTEFRFSTPLKVRIADINYGNHVGNDSYIRFFHEGRMRYLNDLGVSEQDIGDGVGLILTEIHCELKAELFYGEELIMYVRISGIERLRFTMEYQIVRSENKILAAQGETVMVAYNYVRRRPVAIPKSFLEKVKELEGL